MCNRQFYRDGKTIVPYPVCHQSFYATLEEEVGCQLIRRQGKKVSLTEAGERLLHFARPFLQEMSVVREELSGFEKIWSGSYSIGGEPTSLSFLPSSYQRI